MFKRIIKKVLIILFLLFFPVSNIILFLIRHKSIFNRSYLGEYLSYNQLKHYGYHSLTRDLFGSCGLLRFRNIYGNSIVIALSILSILLCCFAFYMFFLELFKNIKCNCLAMVLAIVISVMDWKVSYRYFDQGLYYLFFDDNCRLFRTMLFAPFDLFIIFIILFIPIFIEIKHLSHKRNKNCVDMLFYIYKIPLLQIISIMSIIITLASTTNSVNYFPSAACIYLIDYVSTIITFIFITLNVQKRFYDVIHNKDDSNYIYIPRI